MPQAGKTLNLDPRAAPNPCTGNHESEILPSGTSEIHQISNTPPISLCFELVTSMKASLKNYSMGIVRRDAASLVWRRTFWPS